MRALLIVNHFQISSRVGERLDGRNTSVRGLAARRSGAVLELMHASWFRPGAGERRFVPCPGTFLCWFGGARAQACYYLSPPVERMPAHLRPGGDPRLGRDGERGKMLPKAATILPLFFHG
jgi:hypothetical protein